MCKAQCQHSTLTWRLRFRSSPFSEIILERIQPMLAFFSLSLAIQMKWKKNYLPWERSYESMDNVVFPSIYSAAKHTITQPQYKKKKVCGEMWFQQLVDGQSRRRKPNLYFREKKWKGLKVKSIYLYKVTCIELAIWSWFQVFLISGGPLPSILSVSENNNNKKNPAHNSLVWEILTY